jgi:hypothetical protein
MPHGKHPIRPSVLIPTSSHTVSLRATPLYGNFFIRPCGRRLSGIRGIDAGAPLHAQAGSLRLKPPVITTEAAVIGIFKT